MRGAPYSLYILRCADGSLYTGIALDVDKRVQEHAHGPRGAKYLRGRGPLLLAFRALVGPRAAASRAEMLVKKLSRADKERLIAGALSLADLCGAAVVPQVSGSSGG